VIRRGDLLVQLVSTSAERPPVRRASSRVHRGRLIVVLLTMAAAIGLCLAFWAGVVYLALALT
jgi:hypothetical protein